MDFARCLLNYNLNYLAIFWSAYKTVIFTSTRKLEDMEIFSMVGETQRMLVLMPISMMSLLSILIWTLQLTLPANSLKEVSLILCLHIKMDSCQFSWTKLESMSIKYGTSTRIALAIAGLLSISKLALQFHLLEMLSKSTFQRLLTKTSLSG